MAGGCCGTKVNVNLYKDTDKMERIGCNERVKD